MDLLIHPFQLLPCYPVLVPGTIFLLSRAGQRAVSMKVSLWHLSLTLIPLEANTVPVTIYLFAYS